MQMNLKTSFKIVAGKLTSPTAFSIYGVIGVAATGVLTFLSTKKWVNWREDYRNDCKKATILNESPYYEKTPEEKLEDYKQALKKRPLKEKLNEAAGTALIFAPPVLSAVGTSYSIMHGNRKAMAAVGDLISANNFLSRKVSNGAALAAGAIAGKANQNELPEGNVSSGKYLFSDDPNEVEDYGKAVLFYDEYAEHWFESTIFDVMMAEQEVHKFFNLRGYVSVGEFHSFLSQKSEEWMERCGWDDEIAFKHGYSWVEFKHYRHFTDDGRPYYIIEYASKPAFAKVFEYLTDDYWY